LRNCYNKNMQANYRRALEEAQKVIKNNFITQPPIIAEQIARNYGLNVKYCVFKPQHMDIAGFVDSKGEIIVNSAESNVRKNFTIAHELGHYLLGHLSDPDYDVLYRQPIGNIPNTPLEQEANCFAANLLVPENLLKDCISRFPFATNQQLANLFGVSVDVIGYRRHDLGI